jgi:hypothetical protein
VISAPARDHRTAVSHKLPLLSANARHSTGATAWLRKDLVPRKLYPELTQKDGGYQLQRSNLKREIDQAVNQHSENRQRGEGKSERMLARDCRASPKIESDASDPSPNQHAQRANPTGPHSSRGLQIILMAYRSMPLSSTPCSR